MCYKEPKRLPQIFHTPPKKLLNDEVWKNKFISDIKKGYVYFIAIWIVGKDDELILKSVAKLNKKGELELL